MRPFRLLTFLILWLCQGIWPHCWQSGKQTPGSGGLSEVAASPPSLTVASLSGACGPTISRAGGSHADGLSSISEAVSLESSSGLGLLSMANSCLIIIHMSWVPSAGLVKGEAPFHCGLGWGTCVHCGARSQQCSGEGLRPCLALSWAQDLTYFFWYRC